MSAMTKLDAKALRKAAEVLFDEFCPGVRLTEGDHDFYCERLEPAIRAYLDALPPAQSAGQIDRIEAKLDRVECKISSMSGLINNWVRARS